MLFALCLSAHAQQLKKIPRIGFLWDSPAVFPTAIDGFRQGLRDLGWIEGQNIVIEHRWSEGRFDRFPALAEELVRLNVNVIVAPTSIYAEAAKRATRTIPIIFVEQPTKFDFIINLKAAKQIGLTIPPSMLTRADKVIR
jgi:putative ABC transport system substrate-binding protein